MSNTTPTALEQFFQFLIRSNGTNLIKRPIINFLGGTVADDPANNQTNVSLPGSWRTELDLDFTAQPTQTLSTDGPHTIAGLTWTKGNSANDASPCVITNGTGLVLTPNGNTGYNGAGRSSPYLWLPLPQIYAGLEWGQRLRIYLSIGAETASYGQANTYAFMGLDTNSNHLAVVCSRGSAGSLGLTTEHIIAATQVGYFTGTLQSGSSIDATSKTLLAEFDLPPTVFKNYYAAGLAAGAPFPAVGTFLPSIAACVSVANRDFGPSSPLPANLGIILGTAKPNGGSAFQVTIQRLRVDVFT
jgi:hypothetical protein